MTIPAIVTADTQVNPAFWLNAAHEAVRRECGWHVAPVITETLTLDGKGGTRLLLPSQRVLALASVINDGEDVTSRVRFSRTSGVLTLADGRWCDDVGSIVVTLTHGHTIEEVPDVAALIVTLTKRAAAAGVNVTSQGIGPASVKYATGPDGAPLGLPLLASEKATLAPFTLAGTP